MLRRSPQRRAFTLIEIIVVATLISLLSGIALFSINEMYIRNIRKVSLAETYQLATALSMAENDLIFYPRLNYLRQPKELVFNDLIAETEFNETNFTRSTTPDSMMPGIDYWGIYEFDHAAKLRVLANWKGPYMGTSQARQNANRGAQSGLVKMRLPDLVDVQIDGSHQVGGRSISIVDWPADPFGNPYLLYQFKSVVDPATQSLVPLFLENPTEDGSWRNMIVSYGRNNVPGGNEETPLAFRENTLEAGALYVEGDEYADHPGALAAGEQSADFTLKIIGSSKNRNDGVSPEPSSPIPSKLRLENDVAGVLGSDTTSQHFLVLRSLSLKTFEPLLPPGTFDPDNGQVGVIDEGSDDIILEF